MINAATVGVNNSGGAQHGPPAHLLPAASRNCPLAAMTALAVATTISTHLGIDGIRCTAS